MVKYIFPLQAVSAVLARDSTGLLGWLPVVNHKRTILPQYYWLQKLKVDTQMSCLADKLLFLRNSGHKIVTHFTKCHLRFETLN